MKVSGVSISRRALFQGQTLYPGQECFFQRGEIASTPRSSNRGVLNGHLLKVRAWNTVKTRFARSSLGVIPIIVIMYGLFGSFEDNYNFPRTAVMKPWGTKRARLAYERCSRRDIDCDTGRVRDRSIISADDRR